MGLAERIRKRKFDEDDPLREQHANRFLRRAKDPKPETFEEGDFDADEIRANTAVAKPEDLQ